MSPRGGARARAVRSWPYAGVLFAACGFEGNPAIEGTTGTGAGTSGGPVTSSPGGGDSGGGETSASGGTGPGDGAPTGSGGGGGGVPSGAVWFTDVTAAAGLVHKQGEFHQPPDCLVDATAIGKAGFFCSAEWFSGGVAVADYDGDGRSDLYFSRIYGAGVLMHNEGDGTFADRTAQAGLDGVWNTTGPAFGDIDNDGDVDLFASSVGGKRHALLINDGAGHFTEDAVARGAALATTGQHTGSSAAFGDYDRDGYLDLWVGEYRTQVALGDGPSDARLLHNVGAALPGHFEDVTVKVGVSLEHVYETIDIEYPIPGVLPLSAGFADLDGDGYPELLLASDFGCSRMFWNQGDGTFIDGTVAAGVGSEDNGMGSAVGDFDNDGDLDWFVSSIAGTSGKTGNRLYRYDGSRSFGDATDFAGVRDGGWGWGASFFDLDNDADLDLVMTNGWNATDYLFDPMRLWRNDGTGAMTEISAEAGVTDDRQGRGLVTLDYDGDGDLDILVVRFAQTPVLYRNDSEIANGWLRVEVRGQQSNRDGRGARVQVRAQAGGTRQMQEIGANSHYLGHGELAAHFGLGPGAAPVAEVEVFFPTSGKTVLLTEVARGQTLVVQEPV